MSLFLRLSIAEPLEVLSAGIFAIFLAFAWQRACKLDSGWRELLIYLSIIFWAWIGPDIPKVLGIAGIDFHNLGILVTGLFVIMPLLFIENKRANPRISTYWFFVLAGSLIHVGVDKIFK